MRKAVSLAVLAMTASACGQQPQTKTDPALDKLTLEFVAAFNAKDAAKVSSFYTEDGELMAPGASMVKGRSNIEVAIQGSFEQGTVLQLAPWESAIAGSQAFEAGTFTVQTTSLGEWDEQATLTGRYVIVFKRVGGAWKMAYHMFHLDNSPAAPLP